MRAFMLSRHRIFRAGKHGTTAVQALHFGNTPQCCMLQQRRQQYEYSFLEDAVMIMIDMT